MAGDWLKVEHDTPDKPEVMALAARLGITLGEAFLACFKAWRWADKQTTNGHASVTVVSLDSYVGVAEFSRAMIEVGWLKHSKDAAHTGELVFPHFGYHMGQSAKSRALASKRQQARRAEMSRSGNGPGVTKPLPEKRREEKNKELGEESPNEPLLPGDASESVSGPTPDPAVLTFPTVGKVKSWDLLASKVREYEEAFPALDVVAHCRKALQWVRDNPAKTKTVRGMPAFLWRWLAKEQDRGNGQPAPAPPKETAAQRAARQQAAAAAREAELRDKAPPDVAAKVLDQLKNIGGMPKE